MVDVLFMDSVLSWSRHQKLQEDGLGTKDEIGSSSIHLYNSNLHLGLVSQEISWSRHQNFKRIGVVQLLVMSIKFTHRYSSTWCRKDNHSTRIARGVPLPVYMNLDGYSGFWCTFRCVVS